MIFPEHQLSVKENFGNDLNRFSLIMENAYPNLW